MPTPRDDEFTSSILDTKWIWHNDTIADCSYSLIDAPGNFKLNVGATSSIGANLNNVPYIIQSNESQYFAVEILINTFTPTADGQLAGVFMQIGASDYIFFAKERIAGVNKISAYECVSGTLSQLFAGLFPDDNNIVLRIKWLNGKVLFLYKSAEDEVYQQLGTDYTPATPYDQADVGILGSAETTIAFTTLFNYFHLRNLQDVSIQADIEIICTNIKIVNGDILITVIQYPAITNFEVRQHVNEGKVTILWTNPIDPDFIETRIIKKLGSYPLDENDGTIIADTVDEIVEDTYIGKGVIYYAGYAKYPDKYTIAGQDATMPILFSLFNNITRRFSRAYPTISYALYYSLARALTALGLIDYASAIKQFNINTAEAEFLDAWGSWFGTKRYENETDAQMSKRLLNTVIQPKTIKSSIEQAIQLVDGVIYVQLREGSGLSSMFVGHSYIGFIGAIGWETKADIIVSSAGEQPFFFNVLVKIRQGTQLQRILDAINDMKCAGVRYSVQIIE